MMMTLWIQTMMTFRTIPGCSFPFHNYSLTHTSILAEVRRSGLTLRNGLKALLTPS